MRLLFLDFETYYAQDYSLSSMPTPSYILDPRFEVIMCAVKEDTKPGFIVDGPDFGKFIAGYDPDDTVTVTFNSLFDNSILAWEYGWVPSLMIDSMGMARALRGHELTGASLAKVAPYLGLGEKGGDLVKVKGMNRQAIRDAGLWTNFCRYALQDNTLNAGIFFTLAPEFPKAERDVMDLVLRCAIEPTFRIDVDMLRKHLEGVKVEKAALLAQSGVELGELMSTAKFAKALTELGVTIEYKTSPTGNSIPAFAKTDQFMADLGEHVDIRVQAMAAARLGHKSTIEETRAEKLIEIATLPWGNYRDGNPRKYAGGGTMPVPLRYSAAHTHRLGGDWGLNLQNLPTHRGSKGKSKLRNGLVVAPGHKAITADLGQIEARLSGWICGASTLMQQFAEKKDPYAILGSAIFGFVVDRKIHIPQGFIGKTGILGLGYGCGPDHFFDMVVKMARAAELDLEGLWTPELAKKAVNTYRTLHHQIPTGWRTLDFILSTAWLGKSGPVRFGPVTIGHGYVLLPNGMYLRYADPRVDIKTGEKWYTYGRQHHKLYGAKFLENIVQALARIVVMNAALRIRDRGYKFRMQGHDELVFIVPDADVDNAKLIIHEEMVRRPSWGPDLPLTADIGMGNSYGECK